MLTSLGRATLLASIALLAVAYALGYPDLAIPAAAGCTAVLGAAIYVGRAGKLRVSLDVAPTRVQRGEYAMATVTLENRAKSRSPRLRLRLPYGPEVGEAPVSPLAAAELRQLDLRIRCDHRGPARFGPLAVERSDIFGLCRRVTTVSNPVSVSVYPMIHPLPARPSAWSAHDKTSGARRTPLAGPAFHTLREYVPGDDLRHVHWRASAKMAASLGNLVVREQADTSSPLAAVLLDTSPLPYAGAPAESFEAAVDLAASILVAAARRGHLVHLGTTGDVQVRKSEGRPDVPRLLNSLTMIRSDGQRTLTAAASEMTRNPGPEAAQRGLLTVVTGPGGQVPRPVLDRLLSSYRRVIIIRTGPETGQEPGPRHPVGTRLLVLSAPTAADAVNQWKSALLAGRG